MARRNHSHYPPAAFHGIRIISLLSSAVVSGLLAYFLTHLKSDGFKLPWTLLILLAAGVFTLIYLLFTWTINSCSTLSPLFSFILNIPLILLWLVAFSLLTYNIYGTLGHSCTISNWGNSTGVMVCNIYKLFYSFVLFALLSQIALAVLDLRARAEQKRGKRYSRMGDDKPMYLDTLSSSSSTRKTPEPDVPYGIDFDGTGQRPGLHQQNSAYETSQTATFDASGASSQQPQQPYQNTADFSAQPSGYPSTESFNQQQSQQNYPYRDPAYPSADTFYSHRSHQSRNNLPNHSRRPMYPRRQSNLQSSRSDVPILRDYHQNNDSNSNYNYYPNYHDGGVSYHSSRNPSPYR